MVKSKTFTINKKTNYVGSISFTDAELRAALRGRVNRINVVSAKSGKTLHTITNVVTVAKRAKRIPLRDANGAFAGFSKYFVTKY